MKQYLILTMAGLLAGSISAGAGDSFIQLAGLSDKGSQTIQSYQGPSVRRTLTGDYLAGRHAQMEQDWERARLFTRQALEKDPGNQDLRRRAMILAMGSGDTGQAFSLAEKILGDDPKNSLALLFLMTKAFGREDYESAVKNLELIPENSLAEFIRPVLLAWAKAAMGEFQPEPLLVKPLYASHALMIADYLGRLDDISSYIEKKLTNPASDIDELEYIADIYARHGMKDKALQLYKAIGTDSPKDSEIADKIARLEKNDGKISGTQPIRSPAEGASEALFDMAKAYFHDYSDDSAQVFTRMALHLNPSLDEARIMLAQIMARHEHYEDAIAQYRLIPAESGLYIGAQRSAADLLNRSGHQDEAVALLEKLVKKGRHVNAMIQIGDIYRGAEDYQNAIKAYNAAENMLNGKIGEDYWQLLYARGMTFEETGDWSNAERDLRQALEFQPNHPYLLNYLGYSWADKGRNLDDSLKMIEKAVALRPADGYITDSLGWVLYRMGRYQDSIPHLEKAVELMPYDPVINDHLGDAYWQVGRKLEARFQWSRALNHSDDGMLTATLQTKLQSGLDAAHPAIKEAQTHLLPAQNEAETQPVTPAP